MRPTNPTEMRVWVARCAAMIRRASRSDARSRHQPFQWQFKSGSLAPILDFAQLPSEPLFVAWDRSLGCEVAYAVESRKVVETRRGRRRAA